MLEGRIEVEDAREIGEKEAELIDQLEDLVVEFNDKYHELEVSMIDFFEDYWEPRMTKVLARANSDEDVLMRAREVGVVLLEDSENTWFLE
jgi:hypothetical protein